ncbi:DUF6088 family protein [Aeromonas hydrophila]|uniref:DUF6088 family protein n=1 Tax=Aeromonas hydrophila TaxID=644 RepID=UPI000872DCE2|nr:DUF6088 family protein [Aeromonas hydrophila]OFC48191.1 S-adenosylhomocysteine hydrolase [Aeromonas hydrophila]OFC49426.1 S-adenosylhomocysteine hydrolase [Aeromonas hydrophila]
MTISELVERRIRRSRRGVFLRADFNNLGSCSQVGRALRQMCERGLLLKVGYGVYAKARRNRINNHVMFSALGGENAVLIATLNRLQVPFKLTGMTAAYMEGQTTQIPVFIEVKTTKRFYRKLTIGKRVFNADSGG